MTILKILVFFILVFSPTAACTSVSREGLPPGSPFAEETIAPKPPQVIGPLPDGIAVGDVSSHSAVLWLRTDGPKSVRVEWAPVEAWEKEQMSERASDLPATARTSTNATGSKTDYTLSMSIDDLSPATKYRYRILVGDPGLKDFKARETMAWTGEFTTLPKASVSHPLTFAWSGDLGGQQRCRQGEAGYPIFDVIRVQQPDFFIFLGDTIYSDNVCPSPPNEAGADFVATTLTEYRARHRYQRGAAALRRFLEVVPVYVTWDDHEVKNNFSGPVEPQMAEGRMAFQEYWPIRTAPNDPHRLYRSVRYGAAVELFLLDTRQYRSRNAEPDGPKKTMLGPSQLRWLLDGLTSSDATWKVVVTSVPLSISKGGGKAVPGYDGWAGGPDQTGFELERQMIVEVILKHKLKNVVFLAGDVHFVQANAYDPDDDGKVDFHEFVAGPLSAAFGRLTPPSLNLRPKNLINEAGYYNFGLVHATSSWFAVDIIDDAGKTRFSHKIMAQ
ncbi:alkaline phosphatase D family protein [Petrachloros mirabilis]